MVYGVGVTDCKASKNGKLYKSYDTWCSMLSRCYNPKDKNYENYGAKGVTVHPSWLYYSNFKDWYDKNCIEGYHIDKDIRTVGNKIYSVETCMFVSPTMNTIEVNKRRDYSSTSGNKHFKAKDKKYYENNPVFRNNFKRTCKHMGWNFEDFEEKFYEYHIYPDNTRKPKFIYITKGGKDEDTLHS